MKKCWLISLLWMMCSVALAQGEYHFSLLDVKTGLADNHVRCITRDSYGFIWVGTINGLSRFDGHNAKSYSLTPNPKSPPAPLKGERRGEGSRMKDRSSSLGSEATIVHLSINSDVVWLGEANDGRLWARTDAGDVLTLDREHDCLRNDGYDRLKKMGVEGRVRKLCVDRDGRLWVATDECVGYCDGKKERFQVLKSGNMGLVVDMVSRDGRTIVMTDDGRFYVADMGSGRLLVEGQAELMKAHRYHHIYVDSRHRLWIYTSHSAVEKTRCYDLEHRTWVNSALTDFMGRQFINSMIDDADGNLWVGTENAGIYVCSETSASDFTTRHLKAFPALSSHINCLYQDVNHTMWIGSAKQGVAYTNTQNVMFQRVSTAPFEDVSCMVEDDEGNTWFGFDGFGVLKGSPLPTSPRGEEGNAKANANAKAIDGKVYNLENGGLPSNIVTAMVMDAQKCLWVGTFGEGICRWENGRFVKVERSDMKDMISLLYVKSMAADYRGNVWIGTVDRGLVMIPKEGQALHLHRDNSELGSNSVMSLVCDHRNQLWVGTSLGLHVYDMGKREFNTPEVLRECLAGEYISALFVDSHQNMWIGTRRGLFVYMLKTKQVEWLTTENGLSNNFVRAIVEDSYQHIWVSTDKGLTRIKSLTPNPSPRGEGSGMKNEGSTDSSFFILNSSFLCQPFYDGDGLEQVSFLNNAACLNRDGECMIACSKGYVRIPPQCIHYEYPREKVVFTELLYSGVAAEPGEDSPIRKSLHLERKIEMKYNHTPFSIAVSAMLPTLTQKIVYLYRLKGEGDEWLHIPHNLIHFMGMPSGKHTLEVVAMIPGGPPSEVATLDIIVKPPFWLSTWANVCYLLLLLGAGYIYVLHLKRKQRQKIAMQQMEMELRQQVEMEENKIRFFTNISHDLKTPLTLVMAPLEKTLGFDLERKVRTELEVAWRNARILYDEIVHLLDFRRLDVGAEKLNIAHGDMVNFVQRTVDSFKYYALGKNITTTLKINVASMEMDFDENKMRRIITNLLSNAHKFNKQNGSIVVSLRKVTGSQSLSGPPPTPPRGREAVRMEMPTPIPMQGEEYMELQVADTGRGISAEGKKHIFERFFQVDGDSEYIGTGIGLHIVHEYVLMHGGSITVEDNHPEGTIFTVRIPIIRESGSATGGETDKRQSADGKAVGGAYQDGMLQDGWGGASSDGEEVEKVPDTLLIVEDNSDVREFLQRSLEDKYRILTAANGQEAVDILEGGEENVSLLISDVMMPVMNGLQLCNFVKTNINYSHIPVILLTAKSSESDIIQGLKDGADDYITKPYSLKILELRIRKLLDWKSATLQKIAKGMDLKPSDITVSSLDAELVEKTIRVIEENMSNIDFSVVQLGKEVGLTRGHLYKKLMAITGKSPLELIRIIRLKRGHSLLEQGKSNISEVAADVGFSAKQFSKYFKEEYGCLPSEFLRKK